MGTQAPISAILPIAGIALLIFSVYLLKRGLWPRRIGSTAHCPKCDYILMGDQERCSECGTVVDARKVVRGERRRRPAVAWTGGILLCLAVGMLALFTAEVGGTINWNRYKPLGWLLRELGDGNTSIANVAWREIQLRLTNNALSEDDQNRIAERGLELQAAAPPIASGNYILDFVGRRYLDHKLSAAQADRFFAAACKVNLSVRPVVGTKSRLPYSIAGAGRGPNGWWLRTRTVGCQIDDGPIQQLGGGRAGGFAGWSSSSTLAPVGVPGKHRLRLTMDLATDAGNVSAAPWDDNAAVAKRVTQEFTADFQVAGEQTPISTVTSPAGSVLQPLFKVDLQLMQTNNQWLQASVDAAPLPVDVAFQMFVKVDGKEHFIGNISFRKGMPGGYGTGVRDFPDNPPPAVDVIFRSSEMVAGETLSISQIWKGELTIPQVVLKRPPTPASVPTTKQAAKSNP
jgi:hypothetical protein